MQSYKGTLMSDMYRGLGPWKYDVFTIKPTKYHTLLFEAPVTLKEPPKPHYNVHTHHWEIDYVKMPYSSKNLFPVNVDGTEELKSRWEIIQDALLKPIGSSKDLEAAVKKYHARLPKFTALHYLFQEEFSEEESEHFFHKILPDIIQLALQLPDVVPGSIPLLKADTCKSLSLSQLQVACLLANGFLCTFPFSKDMATYPHINFTNLFSVLVTNESEIMEKLKCIIHYFRRIFAKMPTGVITFERQHIRKSNVSRWDQLTNNLGNTRLHVDSCGTIEDDGLGLLQVDFANKYIGGGVLGHGCVQEEIRFVICPELIVARLFTEKLGHNEALIITGIERFSKYTGYANTFTWAGNYNDATPYDCNGQRRTTITAIDATYFTKSHEQFNASRILRELNKAYAGFHSRLEDGKLLAPVATGNWGCGAFGGSARLKFLIQLMACNAARRDMVYYTFGDTTLRDDIYNIYIFIATNQITIVQLWRMLCRFVAAKLPPGDLFPFIQQAAFDNRSPTNISSYFPKKSSLTPAPSTCQKQKSQENTKHLRTNNSINIKSEVDKLVIDRTPNDSVNIEDIISETSSSSSSEDEDTNKTKQQAQKRTERISKEHRENVQLWRMIYRFVAAKLPTGDLFPFIQQAAFDNRSPTNISSYFPKKSSLTPTPSATPSALTPSQKLQSQENTKHLRTNSSINIKSEVDKLVIDRTPNDPVNIEDIISETSSSSSSEDEDTNKRKKHTQKRTERKSKEHRENGY